MTTRRCLLPGLAMALLAFATDATALNPVSARYDEAADELVITVAYQGTHGNHSFRLAWQECQRMSDGSLEILGILQDSDPEDRAEQEFIKTERLSLDGFPCRPATVFIGGSHLHFRRGVEVPAAR